MFYLWIGVICFLAECYREEEVVPSSMFLILFWPIWLFIIIAEEVATLKARFRKK